MTTLFKFFKHSKAQIQAEKLRRFCDDEYVTVIKNLTMQKTMNTDDIFNRFTENDDFTDFFALEKNAQDENWSKAQLTEEQKFVLLQKFYLAINKPDVDNVTRLQVQKFIAQELKVSKSQALEKVKDDLLKAAQTTFDQLAKIIDAEKVDTIKEKLLQRAVEYSVVPFNEKSLWLNKQLRLVATQVLDPQNQRFELGNLNPALEELLLDLDDKADRRYSDSVVSTI